MGQVWWAKRRATARPANSVCRSVITICFPCTCVCVCVCVCVYRARLKFVTWDWFRNSSVSSSIASGTTDWSAVRPCGCQSRPARGPDRWKQSVVEKCLEGSRLIIWSRSGVYRNSWRRLLTEFLFDAFQEAWFGLFVSLLELDFCRQATNLYATAELYVVYLIIVSQSNNISFYENLKEKSTQKCSEQGVMCILCSLSRMTFFFLHHRKLNDT